MKQKISYSKGNIDIDEKTVNENLIIKDTESIIRTNPKDSFEDNVEIKVSISEIHVSRSDLLRSLPSDLLSERQKKRQKILRQKQCEKLSDEEKN